MTRATAETVRLFQRAEAAVYPVYVPEAAPERVLALPSWDAGAHRRDRYPLTAPWLGSRVVVHAKYHPSSKEEDPISTHIRAPEGLPCHRLRHNAAQWEIPLAFPALEGEKVGSSQPPSEGHRWRSFHSRHCADTWANPEARHNIAANGDDTMAIVPYDAADARAQLINQETPRVQSIRLE